MRTAARAFFLLSLALAPVPVAAQQGDAFVLPPGMIRLRATGELSRFDALFADGGTRSLGSELLTPLTAASFPPLRPLQTELGAFLAQAGSPLPADARSFQLGTLDLAAAASTRVVPLSVAAGVFPRLEIEASLPLVREEILFTRFALSDGTLGANPDPDENAELLARFGEEWRALGSSSLFPTDSSALGRELQRLVEARFPGESLELPDSAASLALLDALLGQEFGLAPLEPRTSAWRAGDLEVSARFELLSTLGGAPVPPDSARVHYRASVSVSGRFPTGAEPDSAWLLSYPPEAGQTGFGLGVDGDLFVGRRLWTTASLRYSARSEVEVLRRVASPGAPLAAGGRPRAVRWSPADLLALRVAPRYRLNDAISLGVQYSLARLGDSSFEVSEGEGDASVLDAPGGLAQSAGFGLRYTTLAAFMDGSRLLPVEISVGYETSLGAPAGRPDATTVVLQASLYHQLIGNR